MDHELTQRETLLNPFRKDTSTPYRVSRFLFVGGLSFVADFGGLWLLHVVFGMPATPASIIAFILSFFVNFFLQKLFTFKSQKRTTRALTLYIILSIINTFATGLFVGSLTPLIGWSWAKITSVIVISTWNYFAYLYLIFQRPNEKTQ